MIGRMVREVIEKKGLSYRKVAHDLGIDHASLYRSLMDGANPEWKTLQKLLNYLGCEIRIVKSKNNTRGKRQNRKVHDG